MTTTGASREPTGLALSRLPAPRRVIVERLAASFIAQYPRGRRTLAVDGRAGTGKTGFADDLAVALRDRGQTVVRASLDDFHFPRAHRYRQGEFSPRGCFEDSYDYGQFRRVLLDPWRTRTGAGFTVRVFDAVRDAPLESEWMTAPEDAVLVVDGVYAQRARLRGAWNRTIYLEAPLPVAIARASARGGYDPDPGSPPWRRWLGAWELYEREAAPRESASTLVDTTDLDAPVEIFADSC